MYPRIKGNLWKITKPARIVIGTFLLTFCYILYEVQYKTGIEILPFIPIDQSGFQLYSESVIDDVYVSTAAKHAKQRGSILCWVMTTGAFHKTKLRAVNSTWLRRCDAGHFLTNNDRFLDEGTAYHTIFEKLPQSYFKLFWKTRLALYYVYKNISSEFDWYFKADDDTYVILDNLRRYLDDFDHNKPYYIGFRLRRRMPEHGYNAGGSGYVLSNAAMKIFAEKLFPDQKSCSYHEWEDLAISRCFLHAGVYATDSRDEKGRQRFLPWKPHEHFEAHLTKSFLFDPLQHWGSSIFHKNLISLHHLTPNEIYLIDGLLYGVAEGIWE